MKRIAGFLVLVCSDSCTGFTATQRLASQHTAIQHAVPAQSCRSFPACFGGGGPQELTRNSWCKNVDGAQNLAVVFFYARWCRSCKAITPVFKRIAQEYKKADFFRVDFKAESQLCYNERVFSFPVVHFYLPSIGRVARVVLKPSEQPEVVLRSQLSRFLGDADGSASAQQQLQLLQQLRFEAIKPVVRYKELVSALQGLSQISELVEDDHTRKMRGLADEVERDEARLLELEALFARLDSDGDGRLAFSDIEAAVVALRPFTPRVGGKREELLWRLGSQSLASNMDMATFVRIMLTKAVNDYTHPERELLPAFEALDLDGNGLIKREDMLATINNFCASLPDTDGCALEQREELPAAFEAFANDEQQLDYERFVEMVSGRQEPLDCEIGDEGYGSIFGDV
mmetsp:Transcript_36887/g.61096  ORF Transcript_36887/g.61096 Transcript_36887/m.61096 type:complete len:401 (-) Transcript_36887:267-1469(-)|eukprot:CAMPEP_0119331038 /NCGR_PEP_ID=MMETSP1333-20130426/79609_1 /TAXON_ID=418940 /ORGANISM="Scyphosphaera apsteinii, Strain RCC1455" /LENGTH=400 /DNA_ID=CAMNT_0007340553 /DNA_START=52 /DNA_END=1254 /DNA_ORIENTATION=-